MEDSEASLDVLIPSIVASCVYLTFKELHHHGKVDLLGSRAGFLSGELNLPVGKTLHLLLQLRNLVP